jgi:hypothetical protein
MKFGIAKNVRSEVRECTPELLNRVLDSVHVARICAEIEDALEKCRKGELTKEEYENIKSELKKKLPIFTFHAMFKRRKRKNNNALPSGLCIYDLDHIPNPRTKWEAIKEHAKELGIVLAHISPSLEGLRLVFIIPTGMTLAKAQAWMAQQLGDTQYDACVKDYARCSFAVPREYVLFLDEEGLFAENRPIPVIQNEAKNDKEEECLNDNAEGSYPTSYEDIPYKDIIEILEEQMGGKPDIGSRNNFIFSMACHLRYICDDNPEWIAQVLPTYGEEHEKFVATVRSACNRVQTKQMPRIMKRTLTICRKNTELITYNSEFTAPPKMPKVLPPLIRLLVSRTPEI